MQLGQRASACTFDHLFVRLPSLCLGVCLSFGRLSKHFSAVHSVFIVCARYIRPLFKLLLKFRSVLKHTESWRSLACNQNIKEDIPTVLDVFFCFETIRNETRPHTCKQILHENIHTTRDQVIFAEELDTMSKNNLRGITLR